jgi:hypothetical protein
MSFSIGEETPKASGCPMGALTDTARIAPQLNGGTAFAVLFAAQPVPMRISFPHECSCLSVYRVAGT